MFMNLNTSRFVWLITFGGHLCANKEKMYSIYIYLPIHQNMFPVNLDF